MKISVIIAAYNAEKYLEVIDRKSIRLKNLTEDLVQTPPSYPLQLPLTQGESWYFFSKMVSNSTLPLFVEGVLERGREFMDYKLVYKFH